ncbi:conserved Plasmodium protein, unknown function [Plasmodium chabaudi chabaudi]|uniref:Uncharacterized protein n=1 Tax=Plasmodium chabaudi chabaudi TaxID=31271 RepID=A0A1D3LHX6_PLACU|nr:conserved Plasmodium protein, unknown function [Plasmodium chabaudi chabaudi]
MTIVNLKSSIDSTIEMCTDKTKLTIVENNVDNFLSDRLKKKRKDINNNYYINNKNIKIEDYNKILVSEKNFINLNRISNIEYNYNENSKVPPQYINTNYDKNLNILSKKNNKDNNSDSSSISKISHNRNHINNEQNYKGVDNNLYEATNYFNKISKNNFDRTYNVSNCEDIKNGYSDKERTQASQIMFTQNNSEVACVNDISMCNSYVKENNMASWYGVNNIYCELDKVNNQTNDVNNNISPQLGNNINYACENIEYYINRDKNKFEKNMNEIANLNSTLDCNDNNAKENEDNGSEKLNNFGELKNSEKYIESYLHSLLKDFKTTCFYFPYLHYYDKKICEQKEDNILNICNHFLEYFHSNIKIKNKINNLKKKFIYSTLNEKMEYISDFQFLNLSHINTDNFKDKFLELLEKYLQKKKKKKEKIYYKISLFRKMEKNMFKLKEKCVENNLLQFSIPNLDKSLSTYSENSNNRSKHASSLYYINAEKQKWDTHIIDKLPSYCMSYDKNRMMNYINELIKSSVLNYCHLFNSKLNEKISISCDNRRSFERVIINNIFFYKNKINKMFYYLYMHNVINKSLQFMQPKILWNINTSNEKNTKVDKREVDKDSPFSSENDQAENKIIHFYKSKKEQLEKNIDMFISKLAGHTNTEDLIKNNAEINNEIKKNKTYKNNRLKLSADLQIIYDAYCNGEEIIVAKNKNTLLNNKKNYKHFNVISKETIFDFYDSIQKCNINKDKFYTMGIHTEKTQKLENINQIQNNTFNMDTINYFNETNISNHLGMMSLQPSYMFGIYNTFFNAPINNSGYANLVDNPCLFNQNYEDLGVDYYENYKDSKNSYINDFSRNGEKKYFNNIDPYNLNNSRPNENYNTLYFYNQNNCLLNNTGINIMNEDNKINNVCVDKNGNYTNMKYFDDNYYNIQTSSNNGNNIYCNGAFSTDIHNNANGGNTEQAMENQQNECNYNTTNYNSVNVFEKNAYNIYNSSNNTFSFQKNPNDNNLDCQNISENMPINSNFLNDINLKNKNILNTNQFCTYSPYYANNLDQQYTHSNIASPYNFSNIGNATGDISYNANSGDHIIQKNDIDNYGNEKGGSQTDIVTNDIGTKNESLQNNVEMNEDNNIGAEKEKNKCDAKEGGMLSENNNKYYDMKGNKIHAEANNNNNIVYNYPILSSKNETSSRDKTVSREENCRKYFEENCEKKYENKNGENRASNEGKANQTIANNTNNENIDAYNNYKYFENSYIINSVDKDVGGNIMSVYNFNQNLQNNKYSDNNTYMHNMGKDDIKNSEKNNKYEEANNFNGVRKNKDMDNNFNSTHDVLNNSIDKKKNNLHTDSIEENFFNTNIKKNNNNENNINIKKNIDNDKILLNSKGYNNNNSINNAINTGNKNILNINENPTSSNSHINSTSEIILNKGNNISIDNCLFNNTIHGNSRANTYSPIGGSAQDTFDNMNNVKSINSSKTVNSNSYFDISGYKINGYSINNYENKFVNNEYFMNSTQNGEIMNNVKTNCAVGKIGNFTNTQNINKIKTNINSILNINILSNHNNNNNNNISIPHNTNSSLNNSTFSNNNNYDNIDHDHFKGEIKNNRMNLYYNNDNTYGMINDPNAMNVNQMNPFFCMNYGNTPTDYNNNEVNNFRGVIPNNDPNNNQTEEGNYIDQKTPKKKGRKSKKEINYNDSNTIILDSVKNSSSSNTITTIGNSESYEGMINKYNNTPIMNKIISPYQNVNRYENENGAMYNGNIGGNGLEPPYNTYNLNEFMHPSIDNNTNVDMKNIGNPEIRNNIYNYNENKKDNMNVQSEINNMQYSNNDMIGHYNYYRNTVDSNISDINNVGNNNMTNNYTVYPNEFIYAKVENMNNIINNNTIYNYNSIGNRDDLDYAYEEDKLCKKKEKKRKEKKNKSQSSNLNTPKKKRFGHNGPPTAEKLSQLLYEQSLSVPQIAAIYGVHRTTVARWCHNRKIIQKQNHYHGKKKINT